MLKECTLSPDRIAGMTDRLNTYQPIEVSASAYRLNDELSFDGGSVVALCGAINKRIGKQVLDPEGLMADELVAIIDIYAGYRRGKKATANSGELLTLWLTGEDDASIARRMGQKIRAIYMLRWKALEGIAQGLVDHDVTFLQPQLGVSGVLPYVVQDEPDNFRQVDDHISPQDYIYDETSELAQGESNDDMPDWRELSLCSQTDPEIFFPEKGECTREAKKVCAQCSVRAECLGDAVERNERFGVWGGLNRYDRRNLKKGVA